MVRRDGPDLAQLARPFHPLARLDRGVRLARDPGCAGRPRIPIPRGVGAYGPPHAPRLGAKGVLALEDRAIGPRKHELQMKLSVAEENRR